VIGLEPLPMCLLGFDEVMPTWAPSPMRLSGRRWLGAEHGVVGDLAVFQNEPLRTVRCR